MGDGDGVGVGGGGVGEGDGIMTEDGFIDVAAIVQSVDAPSVLDIVMVDEPAMYVPCPRILPVA